MNLTQRVLEVCEGLTRHQIVEALANEYTASSVGTTVAALRAERRIRVCGYSPSRSIGRLEHIYSTSPGADEPYPSRMEIPEPRLPTPASVFHLGAIITVDQRKWEAVNQSFRRRA